LLAALRHLNAECARGRLARPDALEATRLRLTQLDAGTEQRQHHRVPEDLPEVVIHLIVELPMVRSLMIFATDQCAGTA
jgi:hypothetical protein